VAAQRVGPGRAFAPVAVAVAVAVALAAAACGSTTTRSGTGTAASAAIPAALARESRPIGRAPAFHPPAAGPILGACRGPLGPRDGVHVELFAANRVVLVAAGIGAKPPLRMFAGRIAAARCFGELATVDPTGVVLVRPGARLTVADLFRSWGQPLSPARMGPFRGRVRVYVGGRPWTGMGPPGAVPLRRHAEIVLEVGPYVPPHPAYHFPPGS
jgi:hypothetical protein